MERELTLKNVGPGAGQEEVSAEQLPGDTEDEYSTARAEVGSAPWRGPPAQESQQLGQQASWATRWDYLPYTWGRTVLCSLLRT